ncbi:tol-pal system protein YbgF [Niveispirillum fermenti]|uniref:tol-pal system protein YbgF n=1 Tax=Niveispirillum fermenti TaxID=1233113 RepID=UPI003A879D74
MTSHLRPRHSFLRRRLTIAAVALAAIAGSVPAAGQSDTREMLNRLQRLENEVQTLNRQVYRGGSAPAGQAAGGAPMAGNVAAGFEVRLQRLESEIQTLTGRYEEATYQVSQLREQLTRMQTDIEFRLNQLEKGQAGSPGAGAPVAEGVAGPSPGVPVVPAEAAAPPPSQTLPSGTAQEQYDFAFNLLRQADYAGAEAAFRAFLQANSSSTLAGNAQYWLAETLYVRGQYQPAAIAFAEGYQKYPRGNKAPDSLLKLALSLSAMKANDDACTALRELGEKYKDAPATIKRRADMEKNRLKCR